MLPDKGLGNLLIDYYGPLLTDHQIEVLNDYYKEDYSMAEIAENLNISKSAASDLLKRSMEQLNDYENKLHLLENADKLEKLIRLMKQDKLVKAEYIDKLEKISRG